MQLFDSHAHLTDGRFADDRPRVLAAATEAGVVGITTIASNLPDALDGVALANESHRPKVWATAGVHPHEAEACTADTLTEIEKLARGEGAIVAIGETGLDFHYENAPRAAQIEAFRGHLELAERLDMPVVVHARDADREVAELVREYADRVVGVLHCFSGSEELLRAALSSDWYVSFSGLITFASYHDERFVREVPAERLLAETDSPYLAPVPHRGRRNEPRHVLQVVERIAGIRDGDAAATAEATYRNACRFYGIEAPGT